MQCIRNVYRETGIRGFYKGLSASYYGIVETVIHLTLYEYLKSEFREYQEKNPNDAGFNILEFMGAGAISKTCASCVAYPHGKSRSGSKESQRDFLFICTEVISLTSFVVYTVVTIFISKLSCDTDRRFQY